MTNHNNYLVVWFTDYIFLTLLFCEDNNSLNIFANISGLAAPIQDNELKDNCHINFIGLK